MALSPLIQQLLMQSQQRQKLSPLEPLADIALAAVLRSQEKQAEQKQQAQQKQLVDVIQPDAPTTLNQVFGQQSPQNQRYWGQTKSLGDAVDAKRAALGALDMPTLQGILAKQMSPEPQKPLVLGPDEIAYGQGGKEIARGLKKQDAPKLFKGEVNLGGGWKAGSVMQIGESLVTTDERGRKYEVGPGQFRADEKALVEVNTGGTQDPAYRVFAKSIDDERNNIAPIAARAHTFDRALELLNSGNIITGSLQQQRLAAENLAATIGITDTSKASNTQELMGIMGNSVLSVIKNFGSATAISDADREYAKLISGADMSTQIDAMKNLVKIAKGATKTAVDKYNSRRDAFVGATGSGVAEAGLPRIEIQGSDKPSEPVGDDEAALRRRLGL